MVTVTRFVGLEDLQDNVQVCVMNPQGKLLTDRSVHNNWKAIRVVVQNTLPTDESGSVVVRASIECCSGAAHLVKAGNPHLRRVIIQAAQRLVNYDKLGSYSPHESRVKASRVTWSSPPWPGCGSARGWLGLSRSSPDGAAISLETASRATGICRRLE